MSCVIPPTFFRLHACMLSHFGHDRLCDPMDHSPPSSSIPGVLQVRILEWVAMPSSRGSSQPRDQTCISYVSCIGRQVLYQWCHLEWRRKRQPTPVFLPRESQGWGSLVGCRLWGRTESDTTEAT